MTFSHLTTCAVSLLGQSSDEAVGLTILLVIVVISLVMFAGAIALAIFILLTLQRCFERVPRQFRDFEPGMVWLLLIPVFGIVWNFFVYLKLSQAYQRYFASIGRYDVGDCGYQLGLWYCILSCCSIIPYLGILPAMVAFVLWIIYIVNAVRLKNLIPEDAAHWGGMQPTAAGAGWSGKPGW